MADTRNESMIQSYSLLSASSTSNLSQNKLQREEDAEGKRMLYHNSTFNRSFCIGFSWIISGPVDCWLIIDSWFTGQQLTDRKSTLTGIIESYTVNGIPIFLSHFISERLSEDLKGQESKESMHISVMVGLPESRENKSESWKDQPFNRECSTDLYHFYHSFPIFVWDIVWKHLRDLRGIPNKKRESREEILPRQRPNLLNAFSQVSAESPRVLTHGGPYDLTTNNQQKNSKWKRCWSSGRSLHNALGISPAGPRFMSQHSSLIWDLPEIPFTVSKDMPADSQSLKM